MSALIRSRWVAVFSIFLIFFSSFNVQVLSRPMPVKGTPELEKVVSTTVEALVNRAFIQAMEYEKISLAEHSTLQVTTTSDYICVRADYIFHVHEKCGDPLQQFVGTGQCEIMKPDAGHVELNAGIVLDNFSDDIQLQISYSMDGEYLAEDVGAVKDLFCLTCDRNNKVTSYQINRDVSLVNDEEICDTKMVVNGHVTDIHYTRNLHELSAGILEDKLVLDSVDSSGNQFHIDAISEVTSSDDEALLKMVDWNISENGETYSLDPSVSQLKISELDEDGNCLLVGSMKRSDSQNTVMIESQFNLPVDCMDGGRGWFSGLFKAVITAAVAVVVFALIINPVGGAVVAAAAVIESAGVAVSASAVLVAADAVAVAVAAAVGYTVAEALVPEGPKPPELPEGVHEGPSTPGYTPPQGPGPSGPVNLKKKGKGESDSGKFKSVHTFIGGFYHAPYIANTIAFMK